SVSAATPSVSAAMTSERGIERSRGDMSPLGRIRVDRYGAGCARSASGRMQLGDRGIIHPSGRLSCDTPLSVEEGDEIGVREIFGRDAPVAHVQRGGEIAYVCVGAGEQRPARRI